VFSISIESRETKNEKKISPRPRPSPAIFLRESPFPRDSSCPLFFHSSSFPSRRTPLRCIFFTSRLSSSLSSAFHRLSLQNSAFSLLFFFFFFFVFLKSRNQDQISLLFDRYSRFIPHFISVKSAILSFTIIIAIVNSYQCFDYLASHKIISSSASILTASDSIAERCTRLQGL